jgi:hypothetical protein
MAGSVVVSDGEGCCRGTRFDAKLLKNMLKVFVYGAVAQAQNIADIAVGFALG